jgi:hypothetical protein
MSAVASPVVDAPRTMWSSPACVTRSMIVFSSTFTKNASSIERLYPANHYVLVDEKPRVLAAAKKIITVFLKRRHYAFDPKILAENPPIDIAKIGDLLNCDWAAFLKNFKKQ